MQDGDGGVSVAEFRACFARFHLLFRSQDRDLESASKRLIERIADNVPKWIRDGAAEATSAIWGAFHSGDLLKAVGHPPGWCAYIVDNCSDGINDVKNITTTEPLRSDDGPENALVALLGFDVEEVEGWATHEEANLTEEHAEVEDEGEWVPIKGRQYLRVCAVDQRLLGNDREPVAVGDIIMTIFGRGGGTQAELPALRSRDSFIALCKLLPFVSLQVYRESLVEEHIEVAAAAQEARERAGKHMP